METKKRIVKCVIDENGKLGLTAMGLVDMPAIEENWVALSSTKIKLASVDNERRMLYGAALIPEKLILRVDKNNEDYYMTFDKATIETLAHDFYKKNLHHTTNLQHAYRLYRDWETDRKSTRLNSSHLKLSRMPSSA